MLLKLIRRNRRLAERRSPVYDKNRYAKALVYAFTAFWAAYLVFVGVSLSIAFREGISCLEGYDALNCGLAVFLFIDFLVRLTFPLPAQEIKPYLLLPIRKRKLMNAFLVQIGLKPFNLFWLFFFVPFGIMSVMPLYGIAGVVGYAAGIWLLTVANAYWTVLARTLTRIHIAWILLPILVYGGTLCLELGTGWVSSLGMTAGEGMIRMKPSAYLAVVSAIAVLCFLNSRIQQAAIYRELAHRPCFVHDLRIVGKSCAACVNELLSLDLNGVLWIGPIEWAKGHGQEFYEEVSDRGLPFVTYGIPHRKGLSGIDFSYREALTELAERFGKEKRRKIRAFLASPFVYEAFSSVCAEYFPAGKFDFAFGSCERIDQFASELAKFLNGELVSSGNLKEAAAFLESCDGWNTCRLVSLGPTTEVEAEIPYLFCDNPYREAARLAADLLLSFPEKPGQVDHLFVEKQLRAHALNGFRNADPTT